MSEDDNSPCGCRLTETGTLLPWRACEPYPSCEGVPMDWHVRTDDDLDYIVCETHDEGLANLIAADHNQQQRLK